MKKSNQLFVLLTIVIVIIGCSSKKKVTGNEVSKPADTKVIQYSYAKDIAPMLTASCTPCHYPPGGRKEPLDSYAAVKKHIDAVIARVKLPKSDNSFMPFMNKKPALSDSAINVLIAWQKNGMAE